MTTITREQALKIIEAADEVISALAGTNEDVHPGSDNMLRLWDDLNDRYAPPEVVRELARIVLASLEAEPVAYIFKHPAGKLFWALTDESNKDQSDVIPVYAAPPVPVVPAALPENDDEDGHDIDYLEPSEVYSLGRTAGWNACRAAMLHGAEPVSQTYKLPPLSSREVNDAAWKLHNMLTEHGPLNGCQFNNLKECFYEALKVAMRNYPVTPDGWISCSERMPDTKTAVLVAVEFDRKGDWRMKWATYIPGHPDANDGWIIPGASWKPSHWMRLPEPPQEVNRG
ncbi:TPA: DUF551 domain-containing protein [Escherichia coli]